MVATGVLIIASGIYGLSQDTIRVGIKNYELEIADTPSERTIGLSNRDSLPQDSGMLFVFDEPGQYGIWMKDTRIDLDIIWLNEQEDVIFIKENVSPDTYPETFRPEQDSLYVIELNAGEIEQNRLELGDTIEVSDYLAGLADV